VADHTRATTPVPASAESRASPTVALRTWTETRRVTGTKSLLYETFTPLSLAMVCRASRRVTRSSERVMRAGVAARSAGAP